MEKKSEVDVSITIQNQLVTFSFPCEPNREILEDLELMSSGLGVELQKTDNSYQVELPKNYSPTTLTQAITAEWFLDYGIECKISYSSNS